MKNEAMGGEELLVVFFVCTFLTFLFNDNRQCKSLDTWNGRQFRPRFFMS